MRELLEEWKGVWGRAVQKANGGGDYDQSVWWNALYASFMESNKMMVKRNLGKFTWI